MDDRRPVRLATMPGPIEARLLQALEAAFTQRTAVPVEHKVLEAGPALDRAKRGGIDAVIAHAPTIETRFVADGWGLARHAFAADEFLLVGPPDDPAGARDSADAAAALRSIADSHEAIFLSRGPCSGMHTKERELWTAAAIEPEGTPWYHTADATEAGSVAVAREAINRKAYTLLERPTYLTVRSPLAVVSEADPRLLNVFTIIPVSPTRCAGINDSGAAAFVDWLLGEEAQAMIGTFRRPDHRVAGFLRGDQILRSRPS